MTSKIPRRAIALLVSKAFGITPKELDARTGRSDRQCFARFAACFLIKELRPETTQRQIAAIIGYVDRSTVSTALERAAHLTVNNQTFAKNLLAARDLIAAWKPGDGQLASSTVFAPSTLAVIPRTPPARKSESPSAFAFLASRMSSNRVPVQKEVAE